MTDFLTAVDELDDDCVGADDADADADADADDDDDDDDVVVVVVAAAAAADVDATADATAVLGGGGVVLLAPINGLVDETKVRLSSSPLFERKC
jgi:hypothetical protein